MNRTSPVFAVFAVWLFMFAATTGRAHNPNGDHGGLQGQYHFNNGEWHLLSNGTIEVGLDEPCGGSIGVIREVGGRNYVNHWRTGRQCQSNIRAGGTTEDWNPTQAGDGPNSSGNEIFYVGTDYAYSKCRPLLFWNDPSSGPPRTCEVMMYQTTEFAPNSNNRAFYTHTYYRYWGETDWGRQGQHLASHWIGVWENFTNNTRFYGGNRPWTGDSVTDKPGGHYGATELWTMRVNSSGAGLGNMSHSSYGTSQNFSTTGNQIGDHTNSTRGAGLREYYCVARNFGEAEQIRDAWSLFYVGDSGDARTFFNSHKPIPAGNFSDNFDDGDMMGWDVNARYVTVENGAVRLRPDSNWTSDLSLPEKYYTDGTFEVDLKCLSGAQWYGIALRKMGPEHFWSDEARNYMIFLRPSGALDLYCNKGGGTLATATVPGFVASDWNTLSVTISGYNFSIKVNGIERINHTDSNQTYPGGWVSLICNNSMEVWFDNFSVTATGDSTAPAPISGFSVSPTGQASQLALSWTNPSDSDYLWTRIMRKEGSSPIHYDDGLPIYQGFMAGFVDRDVSNGTAYYYAAYAVDHSGNYSAAVAGSGIPGGALPVAEFSGVPMSGESPLEVVFTDLSSNGPTEWAWDFENDSVIDSVEQNPTHTYDRPGTYSVKLTATNVDGSDSELKTGLIEVLPNSAQARYWPFYE